MIGQLYETSIFFVSLALTLVFAQAAFAQEDLQCPRYVRLNGVPESALPDLVEPPIAFPGVFGGVVACVLSADGTGVAGLFGEFVPSDGTFSQDIFYNYNRIRSYIRFEGEGEKRKLLAICTSRTAGGLVCFADISGGEGLRLYRFFDADLQITGIRLIATPGDGLLEELVWNAVKDTVLTDPETRIEVIISLPELPQPISLPPINDAPGGQIAYGISGQPAFDFMMALYSTDNPVSIEMNVYQTAFNQLRTTTQERTIPTGNHRFFINHLAKIEQLMVMGFEESKSMDFR